MNLDAFKTVEQLAASIKTIISQSLNLSGLTVGSVGSAPQAGQVQATGDIRTDGGVYVGNKSGAVSNDNLIADGDVSAGGGVYAGSAGGNPGTGEVTATSHVRTDGGVYVGNKGGSVSNDNLVTDGNATIGTYLEVGNASSPLTGTGDLTTADDARIEGDLLVLGTLYTENWQDYSSTSTIVGFSSYSTKELNYKKIGNLVWVRFLLNGTSNSTSLTFTLPHAAQNMTYVDVHRGWDNGGSAKAVHSRLSSGSSTVTFYNGMASTAWTASGDKYVAGGIFYHTT